ncbi:hypothetical protein PSMK_11410 [Phycisphaera mikurensis NBRC 102666]|uniref:Uncharacterized protein n=1 Tax=Phycisphaera mikurensis (strain NBRC 102666 / KCTC 22515 / FYK2301M01) TaxID=1142394 RepID=I0IDG2_PHYMF|nr:hypothetical protein PSMK_11410 [Phycisphaera mikurensis NBRC 102666]
MWGKQEHQERSQQREAGHGRDDGGDQADCGTSWRNGRPTKKRSAAGQSDDAARTGGAV